MRDPFPNNQIPLSRFSQISRNVIALATMRPDLAGVRNNFTYTPGDRDPYQPLEQVQHQARSQPVEQGSASDSCSTGARCSSSRRQDGPGGGLPGAPQQLPRRGFEHARLPVDLGSRHLTDPGQPGELRPQRLVPGARLLQQRQRVGHEDRTEERAGSGQALSSNQLLARLPELGTGGVWRLRQLPLGVHGRFDMGQGKPFLQVWVHFPAGSLRRVRLAHGRGYPTISTAGRPPASCRTARSTRPARPATRSRPSCSAKCSLRRLRPIVMCRTSGNTTPRTRKTTGASTTS